MFLRASRKYVSIEHVRRDASRNERTVPTFLIEGGVRSLVSRKFP